MGIEATVPHISKNMLSLKNHYSGLVPVGMKSIHQSGNFFAVCRFYTTILCLAQPKQT